ncbi:hypothetical protein TU94_00170 [Streptomyces cyaneogriseus subsp. noncyanogenus]|uniref:Uncharacterized protein n=1 Tax=Streptomyces cyaneogriseus subsp. noncyanogenus TaxID=477245 RepID=A0A0C5FRB5_9ACTN|nr:hypothetical protein [Streptomyces cyaneogriseus]AJP00208.1 hypothetical protein TU94_00170 [Streptomyces cyaneogriseus subsp. noncyanogenus]
MTMMRRLGVVAATAAFAGIAAISPASAYWEGISGTVYDDGWSHYSTKRCSTHEVGFAVTGYPDGDAMRHKPTSAQGGGGTVYSDVYFGGTTSSSDMGISSGRCFYWNARQYEGILETDWEDVWFGQINYRY